MSEVTMSKSDQDSMDQLLEASCKVYDLCKLNGIHVRYYHIYYDDRFDEQLGPQNVKHAVMFLIENPPSDLIDEFVATVQGNVMFFKENVDFSFELALGHTQHIPFLGNCYAIYDAVNVRQDALVGKCHAIYNTDEVRQDTLNNSH